MFDNPLIFCGHILKHHLKPRHRLGALSFPAMAFVYRVVPTGTGRQTNSQTQTREPLASSFCLFLMNHPTFICDQLKAPWLPSPLPFPELHLQRGSAAQPPANRAVESRYSEKGEISESERHSAASPSASFLLITHICPQPRHAHPPVGLFPLRSCWLMMWLVGLSVKLCS